MAKGIRERLLEQAIKFHQWISRKKKICCK